VLFDPAELPESGYSRLVAVMERLRGRDGGCPWDLEQSLATLKPFLIEECYETLDAIDGLGDAAKALPGQIDNGGVQADPDKVAAHREELGDVLLQVVFQAQVADELGWYTAEDVATGIADKMVRRHPHVFAQPAENSINLKVSETVGSVSEPGAGADSGRPETADQVLDAWNAQKRAEGRKADKGILDGVPRQLPGLLRGQRIGEKAARVGFDWPDVDGALGKVDEELAELREAIATGDPDRISDELGDALFALVSVGRKAHVDAETALRGTLDKFSRRFAHVEQRMNEAGLDQPGIERLQRWWREAKDSA